MCLRHYLSACLGLAVAGGMGTTRVEAQTGVVFGTVYDSISSTPLANAAVFLWDTSYRGVSDVDGRFRIEGVAPGDYSVLFFHARLGDIGVSPGPHLVHVENEDVRVDLGTPSMFTLISSRCLMEEHKPVTGTVAGWVGDGASGMGLPGARVTLTWGSGAPNPSRRIEAITDGRGWYNSCGVPADVPILAHARFLDRSGPRREIAVSDFGATQASFMVMEMDPTRVSGQLVDAASANPVTEAEVWLRGTPNRTLTDEGGRFRFDEVLPGRYMLMTKHLAYGTKMDTLDVPGGQRISVEMKLDTRAIEITPITVTVDSRRRTEIVMGGIQIPSVKIAKVRQVSRDAADILRAMHIPGVIVRRYNNGALCVGYITGQVRMLNNTSGGCQPMLVFINGAKASNTILALQLPPDAIDRMVIYRPVEAGNLFGADASRGVLMIYTRGN